MTSKDIELFLAGMSHALKICEANKTGQTSRQAHEIKKEITTLSILKEKKYA